MQSLNEHLRRCARDKVAPELTAEDAISLVELLDCIEALDLVGPTQNLMRCMRVLRGRR